MNLSRFYEGIKKRGMETVSQYTEIFIMYLVEKMRS